jgi:hypothetical protein
MRRTNAFEVIEGERQEDERLVLDDAWRDHGLVFASSVGMPIEPRNVNWHWDELRRKAGLESTVPCSGGQAPNSPVRTFTAGGGGPPEPALLRRRTRSGTSL